MPLQAAAEDGSARDTNTFFQKIDEQPRQGFVCHRMADEYVRHCPINLFTSKKPAARSPASPI
jgi:hypothetical protein